MSKVEKKRPLKGLFKTEKRMDLKEIEQTFLELGENRMGKEREVEHTGCKESFTACHSGQL